MKPESVNLFYREGSSNKIYQTQLEPKNDGLVNGWVVNFQYGRRGSSLQSGTKTPKPVSFEKAEAIFNKLVVEKTQKGYTLDESGIPYVASGKEEKISGLIPQLLNSIDEEDLEKYFKDDNYLMQEKMDGKRIMLRRAGKTVEAINRKGLVVGFPKIWEEELLKIRCDDFVLDGEAVGSVYYAFDLRRQVGSTDEINCYARYLGLCDLLKKGFPSVQVIDTFGTEEKKRQAFAAIKARRGEGVVFKDGRSFYKPGRPNSGGPQVKFKFTATCSVIVGAINEKGKRSVNLLLLDGKKEVPVGKVTILPNFPIPQSGNIVEVQYLYAYLGGSLYQPVYLGERDDVDRKACRLDQLKYKVEDSDDAEV